MTTVKTTSLSARRKAKQDHVLDAATRLLSTSETADFSMRDLALEAGVSFATPFNYFGSKIGIMHALSARLIETMASRFASATVPPDAVMRVLAAWEIAVSVLLEAPAVTRPVIGSLGNPTTEPGVVADLSRALWGHALGDYVGIRKDMRGVARQILPTQLALGFRGCISFWVAGEIADKDLRSRATVLAATILFGFVEPDGQTRLARFLAADEAVEPS